MGYVQMGRSAGYEFCGLQLEGIGMCGDDEVIRVQPLGFKMTAIVGFGSRVLQASGCRRRFGFGLAATVAFGRRRVRFLMAALIVTALGHRQTPTLAGHLASVMH